MVHFKKVRWRNVLSTGQMMTEIQLDRSPSTMVTGKNGGGKSTMLDAITFALFGKPFRKINKGQMVNTKNNRDMLCEIEFDVGQDSFLIRRGIKPDIFEVFKNGSLQNQPGDNRDYQRTLNAQVLGMDYQSFTQIVAVGKAQHVSFMKLDSAKRRLFVESILNLLVFSNMNRIHTANMAKHKEKALELKSAIAVAGEKVELRKRYISDLEREAQATEENELARRRERITRLEQEIQELVSEKENLQSVEPMSKQANQKLKQKIEQLKELVLKFNMKLEEMGNRIEFLQSNTVCQACEQEIPEETRVHQCDSLSKRIEDCTTARNQVEEDLLRKQSELAQMKDQDRLYNEWLIAVQGIDSQIKMRQIQIDDLKEDLKVNESTYREKILDESNKLIGFKDIYERLLERRADMADKSEYYNIISMMLKDGGIKSMIIKRFISIINHAINTNLAKLGFFAKFTLDENFDETIQARGIDTLSYNNFSEGEKLRIDMAILLAWRDVAKMQSNVSTNLLIFDEVLDGSLDTIGTDALVSLLNELKDTNIFIVTHSPDKIADKVRSQISFQKVDGFSKLMA